MVERVGFEPTVALTTFDFESNAFVHSATSPKVWVRSRLSLGIARLGRPFPSAKLAEELSQHGAAFFCHDPRHQLEAVVQLGVGAQVAHTSTESCFGVVRSVDTALDLRENHRAGAHRAWLQGDVDRAVFKAPVALCRRNGAME